MDLFNHFGNDAERNRVIKAGRSEEASNEKMMVDRMIKVSNTFLDLHPVLYCCNT